MGEDEGKMSEEEDENMDEDTADMEEFDILDWFMRSTCGKWCASSYAKCCARCSSKSEKKSRFPCGCCCDDRSSKAADEEGVDNNDTSQASNESTTRIVSRTQSPMHGEAVEMSSVRAAQAI